jgi:hypothetical protein
MQIPFDRIEPVDGSEVRVGMLLVDPDYVPFDGAGVVLAISPGAVVHRVTLLCVDGEEERETEINMMPGVFVGWLRDCYLHVVDRDGILAALGRREGEE